MIIDCISDLHGKFPKLSGGDLLLIAGDLTANQSQNAWCNFFAWIRNLKYERIIFISGNHDNTCTDYYTLAFGLDCVEHIDYLCDSGTEFKGLKIWGSPWTKTFPGMNPHCKAFTVDTEKELDEKWQLIPNDTDILITHSPP